MKGRRRPGVTLIELMIAVAVMGTLAAGAVPVLPQFLRRVTLMNQAQSEIALSGQTALSLLANDIRSAAVVEPEWREYRGGEGCLILRLPTEAGEGDRIVYRADPRNRRQLLKEVFPAPGSRRQASRQILARNLKSLRFSPGDSPAGVRVVRYELSFVSGYHRTVFREGFRGAAGLRNGR